MHNSRYNFKYFFYLYRFKASETFQAYGLTEATLGIVLMPSKIKLGSVGKVVAGMGIKVRLAN